MLYSGRRCPACTRGIIHRAGDAPADGRPLYECSVCTFQHTNGHKGYTDTWDTTPSQHKETPDED